MLPNDEQENDRLDMHHALMLHLLDGKLYLAPISKIPQRVLDLGTGTGIWAIDFGNSSITRFRLGERTD
jgi:ubiquinone/menaquinone biosynthesis C-methylase UbiE